MLYSREREIYDKAYNEAMSSSGPTTRSETKDKPVKTYPGTHPRHEAYQMQRDAEEAAIVQKAIDQAKADKAKADKAKADKAKAANAQADNVIRADDDQAKAADKGRERDESVPLVTRSQKCEGLKLWKELLIQMNEYRPFQKRTEEENLKEVKILKAAMGSFRLLKLQGMASLRD